MKTTIKIAQIRMVPGKGDLAGNHKKLMAALGELAAKAIDVVITPECFLDGYVVTETRINSENLKNYAINPATSPYVRDIAKWARKHSAWVIFGCSRLTPEGVFNTALIFNRQGKLQGWYDKIHCQTHDKKFIPGRQLGVFKSDFGRFGVMICADRRWPETVRSLALQGARIIFNPTYGMHEDKNLRLMQTRSYESEIVIVFTHPRQSLITDATGEILLNATGEDHSFAICEIDLAPVDQVRAGDSAHLRDRRSDLYTR